MSLLAAALEPGAGLPGILSMKREEAVSKKAKLDADYPIFADFDSGWGGWYVTGEAFGELPTVGANWNSLSDRPDPARPSIAHSGLISKRLQGVIRSPSFTIEHPHIYYHLAGENAEVRLIVDGYTMIEFHQLLFGGLKFQVSTRGEFGWHHQSGDLKKYLGHRAYIEVIDHGDGYVAIDEIRFSNENAAPAKVNSICSDILSESVQSPIELANRYGDRWEQVLARWHLGTISADEVEWLAWGIETGWVPLGTIDGKNVDQWLEACHAEQAKVAERLPEPIHVPAMTDGPGENERIFIRGNHRLLGDEAPRQMLQAIVGREAVESSGSGRLELARCLVDSENPLTSRVVVNRLWQHLIGRGIVASVDNFGTWAIAQAIPNCWTTWRRNSSRTIGRSSDRFVQWCLARRIN